MLESFRLLRFRLTMLYVLVFGLLQALLWIGVDVMRSNVLLERLDRLLLTRAQGLMQVIENAAQESPDPDALTELAKTLEPFEAPDTAYQVRHADGRTIARSPNLHGLNLPFNATADLANAEVGDLRTVRGEIARMIGDPDSGLRLLTLYQAEPGRVPYVLQVSADLGPMDRELTEIRRLLLLFGFVSLVVAGVTSWYMANRSLAPIGQIARQARQLSADRLEQRLPQPRTTGELAELVSVINEMLDRLEAEFKEQEHFIANVSHEMKTPLAILLGEAGALERGSLEAEQVRSFLSSLQEESRRLLRTVESFLILTRVRMGARPATATPVAIDEVVLDAVRVCQADADERGVRLVPHLDAGEQAGEPIVSGDPDLLRSMIENLLHNAIRHSPPAELVEVSVALTSKEVAISVLDCGPGFPAEDLTRVFEPYYRSMTGKAGTAGLGLSIIKRVAQFHGGAVEVHNRPEGGCVFTVRLPLAT